MTMAFERFALSGLTLAQNLLKPEPNEINFSQGFSQKVVSTSCFVFNSLPARGDFCFPLITFANSLDPDQARHIVGPDLDTWIALKNSSTQRVKYGTIMITCEGIIKARFENPIADQNTLFCKYVILEPPRLYF